MSATKRLSFLLFPLLLVAALIPLMFAPRAYADDPVWLEAFDASGTNSIIVGESPYENGQHHMGQYERGTNVKLTAHASQYSSFEGWYVAGDGFTPYWTYSNPLYIDLTDDNTIIEAHFKPVDCVLCIDVSGDGEFYYDGAWRTFVDTTVPAGTYVGLDINPGTYSRFAGWSDGAGKTAPYYFYVYGDTYLTANFEAIPYYNLTLSVNDTSMGEISYVSTWGGYEGDYIKLEASAYKDYYFCGWTDGAGNPVSSNEAYEFNIYSDTTLVANFDSIYAKRKIVTLPGEGSGIMPDYEVQTGTDFTLPECTFTPPYGKTFDEWNVGPAGKKITVNSDMTITALWKDLPQYLVHIEPNGGTGYIPDPWIYQGYKYTLPDNPFEAPEGKVFDTWDLGAPGTEITVTGETWMYAQWKDKEAPTYSCESGNNASWKNDSTASLTFVFKRSIDDDKTFSDHFADGKGSVTVDGKVLDPSLYTAESGSLKLTFAPDFLKTLPAGTHNLQVTFDDGSATARFSTTAAQGNKNGGTTDPDKGGTTGGGGDLPLVAIGLGALCLILLGVIIGLLVSRKKGNHER